ncbi:MAG: alkene reductase [Cytophagales bacterium]|nr:alkene reductase [Cytophagales bacterium]
MTNHKLFSSTQAGSIQLANRIVMAPLTRNRAPQAQPNALMQTYYAQRATAGLIITEATAISHQGQGYSDVPGVWSAQQVEGWRAITKAVHAAGGKMVMQLWHVGRVSHNELQPSGGAPVAPSAIRAKAKTVLIRDGIAGFVDTSEPRALRMDELPGIVANYRTAARNAIDAGMDGVEIHAANGYLLDQFMKSGANQRTDAYGGSIENRARFMLEVMHAVVQEIGGERVGIRLSPVTPSNGVDEDNPQPLFDYVAAHLAPLGLAYLHIIEGATGQGREVAGRPFDYAAFKACYTNAGGKGAWMVNNCYDLAMAKQAVTAGADLVAFGRPFISNPDLVARLRTGAALNELNRALLYGGGAAGYTDYPTA